METEVRCLACYQQLSDSPAEFHPACARRLFGPGTVPPVECSLEDITRLAEEAVRARLTVPGVQPKLSLGLHRGTASHSPRRLTLVDAPAGYILKPPSPDYPFLPELEDLCMHLAGDTRIPTVPHSLVRLASGELAYLTRRIDRAGALKIHMEDMCQLSGKPTEAKYRASHEQVARLIKTYSAVPLLDVTAFYEQVLFCFLTGNSDMHLKNVSLLHDPQLGPVLSPAYDLVPSNLLVPADLEELALSLNGRKRKLTRSDFETAMRGAGMEEKAISNLFARIGRAIPGWESRIAQAFLPEEWKERLWERVRLRAGRMEL